MAIVRTTIQIDEELKIQAQQILDGMGLSLSAAVNLFLQQVVREGAIPFRVENPLPNADTLEALAQVQQMKTNPESGKGYTDIDGMVKELLE